MKNLLAFLTKYKTKKAQLDSLTAEVEEMKKELLAYTKGNYEKDESGKIKFTCGQYTVTITTCTRTDIDKKRLAEEKPDIVKEYTKVSEYERTNVT